MRETESERGTENVRLCVNVSIHFMGEKLGKVGMFVCSFLYLYFYIN